MLRILGPLAESLLFVLLLTRRFTFPLLLNRITEINSHHLPIRDFDTQRVVCIVRQEDIGTHIIYVLNRILIAYNYKGHVMPKVILAPTGIVPE